VGLPSEKGKLFFLNFFRNDLFPYLETKFSTASFKNVRGGTDITANFGNFTLFLRGRFSYSMAYINAFHLIFGPLEMDTSGCHLGYRS